MFLLSLVRRLEGNTARAEIKDKGSIVLLYYLPRWNVCAAIMLSGLHEMLELTILMNGVKNNDPSACD